MRRKLGAFELAQTLSDEYSPFNAVGILQITGGPDADTLRRALGAVQRRHPLLGVRLDRTEKGFFYESHETPDIPLSIIERQGDDHWMMVAEHELNTRIDTSTGPLARFSYLKAPGEQTNQELVFTFHHSITDGTGAANVFSELLSLCQAGTAGHGVDESETMALLSEAERLFPVKFRGIGRYLHSARFLHRMAADEIACRWQSRTGRQAPIHLTGKCRILPMHISKEATGHLIRKTRRERVTVNSVLCAAILMAVNRHLYSGQHLPLRVFLFANLRPYLKPPVPAKYMGSYHSAVRVTTRVGGKSDFLECARRINAQTYTAAKRGDKFIANVLSPVMMRTIIRMKRMRMATVALSYIGSVNFQPSSGPVTLRGIHSFASNFPLGPEYTANARLYQGKLWWDIVYLDSDMDRSLAQVIADEIRNILETAGDSRGGI